MAKKYKVTPKGELLWPHLTKPDTKFNEGGVYHVKLVLSPKEAKPLIAEIDAVAAAALEDAKKEVAGMPSKNGKKPKAKPCEDKPYSTNDEGMVEISFKMNATGKSRKTGEVYTQSPTLFDSNSKPITDENIKIGSGTVAKISYEAVPFFTVKIGAGCSLRLKAVQILSLVEWGGDGKYFGFAEEEGDFSADSDDDSDDDENEETTGSDDEGETDADDEDEGEEEEEDEKPAPVSAKNKKAAPAAAAKKSSGKAKKPVDDEEDF